MRVTPLEIEIGRERFYISVMDVEICGSIGSLLHVAHDTYMGIGWSFDFLWLRRVWYYLKYLRER